MSGTIVSTLHILTHLNLTAALLGDTNTITILQVRKLKLKQVK